VEKSERDYVRLVDVPGNWYTKRFELVEDEPANTNAAPTQGINPKDLIGSKKPDYGYVPMAPLYEVGKAMRDGAQKYGPFNWREQPVNANVYVNAARRHLDLWAAGEEIADDSKVHHLAHAMACMVILMDAQQHNSLNDNRVRDDALIRYIKENAA